MGDGAETDAGDRPGLTTDERARMKELEKENSGLRRASEILKVASLPQSCLSLMPRAMSGPRDPEAVDDGVVDRLQGGKAVADLGHVHPGFV